MKRKYAARLIVENATISDWFYDCVCVNLFRNQYSEEERKEYDFSKLIENYNGLEGQVCRRVEDYILRLFTMSEIQRVGFYLTESGPTELSHQEITFPINVDFDFKVHNLVLPPRDDNHACYVFKGLNARGYCDTSTYEVFKKVHFETVEEKKEDINELLGFIETRNRLVIGK